ncbi:MAG: hypothetical protein KZQ99_12480 [Candidatus Thiodiazotropha sp. (ex Dulcina madagascariensis)]|nr:hypothetical protein [Candidatus Thiodiazotropha sp. (ex Dulcina madagascariensis)]
MVSPVNSDKPINTTAEKSGYSNRSVKTDQTTVNTTNLETHAPEAAGSGSTLEVDKARRLFEMEAGRANGADSDISTPAQARALLDNILRQFTASPEDAMKSQSAKATQPLASLLENAPA